MSNHECKKHIGRTIIIRPSKKLYDEADVQIEEEPNEESEPKCVPYTPTDDIPAILTMLRQSMKKASKEQLEQHIPDLLTIVRDWGETIDIDLQKKKYEIIYAHQHGYKVRKEQGGADMYNVESGKQIEHKYTTMSKTGINAMRCNVNIKIPARPKKTKPEDYLCQVHDNIVSKGDVHIEVRVVHDPDLSHVVELPAEFVANYAKAYITYRSKIKRTPHLNIGGSACPICFKIHRLEFLKECSQIYESYTEDQWQKLVEKRIPYKCKEKTKRH